MRTQICEKCIDAPPADTEEWKPVVDETPMPNISELFANAMREQVRIRPEIAADELRHLSWTCSPPED